jgi:hypothetical protein
LDWCLGTIPVGVALALVFGMLAYAWAKRRRRAPPPPPSSESPPSGSPASPR